MRKWFVFVYLLTVPLSLVLMARWWNVSMPVYHAKPEHVNAEDWGYGSYSKADIPGLARVNGLWVPVLLPACLDKGVNHLIYNSITHGFLCSHAQFLQATSTSAIPMSSGSGTFVPLSSGTNTTNGIPMCPEGQIWVAGNVYERDGILKDDGPTNTEGGWCVSAKVNH